MDVYAIYIANRAVPTIPIKLITNHALMEVTCVAADFVEVAAAEGAGVLWITTGVATVTPGYLLLNCPTMDEELPVTKAVTEAAAVVVVTTV